MLRELSYGYMYAHLQNVNVDWDLEGSTVCRVEGNGCHGHDFEELDKLQQHLRTPYHLVRPTGWQYVSRKFPNTDLKARPITRLKDLSNGHHVHGDTASVYARRFKHK